jgi:hypothetical protein
LQKETSYVAAPTATTIRHDEVRALLAFLRTADVRALFAAKGFIEPA